MDLLTGQQHELKEVLEKHQETAKAIVLADGENETNYQYLLEEKIWIKLSNFPQSVGWRYGIFEINNTYYVVGNDGITTPNNVFHKFPSNKEYRWCATCRVGNNILIVCKEDGGEGRLRTTGKIYQFRGNYQQQQS